MSCGSCSCPCRSLGGLTFRSLGHLSPLLFNECAITADDPAGESILAKIAQVKRSSWTSSACGGLEPQVPKVTVNGRQRLFVLPPELRLLSCKMQEDDMSTITNDKERAM